ncbi:MAG: Fe(2+)-trafficking protein [Acidobacteriia bacterium]|nr:Fe(2+)-trafficking protein [Terriglobia bacterium]
MEDIGCSRCGVAPFTRLERAPLPGPVGEKVRERVCPACWREWLGMQVRVINEYRLVPAEPQQYEYLLAQMKAFLNLKDD